MGLIVIVSKNHDVNTYVTQNNRDVLISYLSLCIDKLKMVI